MEVILTAPDGQTTETHSYDGNDAFLDRLEQGYTLPADFEAHSVDERTGLITAHVSPQALVAERRFRRSEEEKKVATAIRTGGVVAVVGEQPK